MTQTVGGLVREAVLKNPDNPLVRVVDESEVYSTESEDLIRLLAQIAKAKIISNLGGGKATKYAIIKEIKVATIFTREIFDVLEGEVLTLVGYNCNEPIYEVAK